MSLLKNRAALYWAANACFLVLLAIGAAIGSANSAHPLYLALLFAICSSPILNVELFNDRYALLVIFSAVYFQFYGVLDLVNLYRGAPISADTDGPLSHTELVILLGGGLAQIGYRIACRPRQMENLRRYKDWPEHTLVIFGCVLWCVATWFTWKLKVNVFTAATAAATASGLASLGAFQTIGLLLANMLQPLAILILAYAQCRYKRAYMLPLVVVIVLVQLVFGFVIDVKGEALIGAILVVVTKLLVDGRIPKGWLIAFIAFVAVAFPALQANRILRNQYHLDNTEVAQRLLDVAKEAFVRGEQLSSGPVRTATVFERGSLKGPVEMIITRTGDDVRFQNGYTLTPIYAAFIPRIVWPNKPDVSTGQLVNKEFQVSENAYVYISPSHLGELYWNFGWTGVSVGMLLIGLLLGHVGKHVDMSRSCSITQLMIAAVTVRMLVLGFESSISNRYVLWMRSLAAIGILHMLFSARRTTGVVEHRGHDTRRLTDGEDTPRFPNLLR